MIDKKTDEKNNLKQKKLFLLDMDGTLYLDDRLFDGALEFLSKIRKSGGKYAFLTNNSSRGVESYVGKMKRLGVPADRDDFITSVDALVYRLRKEYGQSALTRKMYIMGTESFKEQMRTAGFNITDLAEDDVKTLVIGFDRELTFAKLEDACRLLSRKDEHQEPVDYFATNPDWVCPTEYGYVPDCGSFAFMLEKATGRKPEFVGKPEPLMAFLSMERYGFNPKDTLIIGDRLYTDIACGLNAGVDTAFVLSGEGTYSDIGKTGVVPTYIFKGVGEISNEIFGDTEIIGDTIGGKE